MRRVSYYFLIDLLRNKVILGYILLWVATGWGTFLLEGQPEKALLILMQVTLLLLPMITSVFASVYYYQSMEFILLLLTQPLGRYTIFKSFYASLTLSFTLGYILGICLPLWLYHPSPESLLLLAGGVLLILIFSGLAMVVSIYNRDKARGLGITLLLWAFFAFIYDGILLLIMYQLASYPIERPILFLSFFNPIDIARILIIMETEASAMLGLSGAVFQQFFGSTNGMLTSFLILIGWTVLPLTIAWRKFVLKDL